MKRGGRPNLSKYLQNGERITIVASDRAAYNARVAKPLGKGRFRFWVRRLQPDGVHHWRWTGTINRRDEGALWARGWDTEAADALRAAVMLSPPRQSLVTSGLWTYTMLSEGDSTS